jgi:hypothetical protein
LKLNIDKDFVEKAKGNAEREKMIKNFAFSRVVFLIMAILFILFYAFLTNGEHEFTIAVFSVVMFLAMDSRVKMLKLYSELIEEKKP